LIEEATKTWRKLAGHCFDEIKDTLVDHIDRLVKEHFGKYAHGGLLDIVSLVVRERIRHREAFASQKIESLCQSEDAPYTQNEDFFFSIRTKLLSKYKSCYRQANGRTALFQSNGSRTQQQLISDAMAALAKLGLHGFNAEDMIKVLPEEKMDPALEIMAEVRAYFQVAYKRFGDNIPKQIDNDFIRGFEKDLHMTLMGMEITVETCRKWLQESPANTKRREELLGKKARFESAREKLGPAVRALLQKQLLPEVELEVIPEAPAPPSPSGRSTPLSVPDSPMLYDAPPPSSPLRGLSFTRRNG